MSQSRIISNPLTRHSFNNITFLIVLIQQLYCPRDWMPLEFVRLSPTVSLTLFYTTATCHGYATLIFLNENVCAFYACASFSCVTLISSRRRLYRQSPCLTIFLSRPRRWNFYCVTPSFSSIVILTLTFSSIVIPTLTFSSIVISTLTFSSIVISTFDCVYFPTLTFDYVHLLTSIVTYAVSTHVDVAYIPEKMTTIDATCDFLPGATLTETDVSMTLNDLRDCSTCRGHAPTAVESRTCNPGRRRGIRFSGFGRRARSCRVCPSDNSAGHTTLEGKGAGREGSI